MSTYSEAWHSMDPDLRNFYVSWSQANAYQLWHWEWSNNYQMWFPVNLYAQSLGGYVGYHIAQRNWSIQTFETGSFDQNHINLIWNEWGINPSWEPQRDPFDWYRYWRMTDDLLDLTSINIYVAPPTDPPTEEEPNFWGYPMPRAKYKIRRSYWTGAPRRRRNL
jgi:hypothetical protein